MGVNLKASQLFGFTVRRPLLIPPAASSAMRPSSTANSRIFFDSFERVVVTFARLPALAPAVSGMSPSFPRFNAAPAGSQLRGSAASVYEASIAPEIVFHAVSPGSISPMSASGAAKDRPTL